VVSDPVVSDPVVSDPSGVGGDSVRALANAA